MNDDIIEKMRAQARDLQKQISEAMAKGNEQSAPYVERARKEAENLRETLMQHARQSAALTNEQTTKALDDLNSAMKSGTEAFFTRAREVADQISKAFEK